MKCALLLFLIFYALLIPVLFEMCKFVMRRSSKFGGWFLKIVKFFRFFLFVMLFFSILNAVFEIFNEKTFYGIFISLILIVIIKGISQTTEKNQQ